MLMLTMTIVGHWLGRVSPSGWRSPVVSKVVDRVSLASAWQREHLER